MRAWLTHVLTEPLTIMRAPRGEDVYGQDIPEWSEADSEPVLGRLQPSGESENLVGRDQQTADMLAFLPPDTEITGRDRIADTHGNVYEVIGAPRRLREPWSSTEHHVRAALRQIGGL